MTEASPDQRSAQRRVQDEQLAAEPLLPPPDLPLDAKATPVEEHLGRLHSHPQAFVGIVENGLIRLLDPDVELPEQSRVIVVAPTRR
jgi:hypothetical protein